MRKSILDPKAVSGTKPPHEQDAWLDLQQLATVEMTSEDPRFPVENALEGADPAGWRASGKGPQTIRLNFGQPVNLNRIAVRFADPGADRSQEFSIHARTGDGEMTEVVRQQFTFSPGGSSEESEDYAVELRAVTILELRIDPDRAHDPAHSTNYAVLKSLRLA